MDELELFEVPVFNVASMSEMLLRFAVNMVFIFILIHFFYYRKSRRLDYYFTFTLISISIFFLIYLLESVKIKVGMALGLFAIFGIIRYRTETVPVREMTYLFVIISLSVINALASDLSFSELLITNAIYVGAAWLLESFKGLRHVSSKLILYDRIDNIQPERREDLLNDLRKRTGLKIIRVDVGAINFLQDTVMIKIYYEGSMDESYSVNHSLKLPKEEG